MSILTCTFTVGRSANSSGCIIPEELSIQRDQTIKWLTDSWRWVCSRRWWPSQCTPNYYFSVLNPFIPETAYSTQALFIPRRNLMEAWGELLVGRSRDRFPVVSLRFFFCGSFQQNHVLWSRLSLWNWVPGISPGVKAAGVYGWRPTTLVVSNVEMIRGLNLPGTRRATSACRGIPLFYLRKLMRALHTKALIARQLDHVQSVSWMDYLNGVLLIFKVYFLISSKWELSLYS